MGLTNQERINFNSKVLAAKVIDNNAVAQWYESKFPYAPNSISQRVPLEFGLILANPASTLSQAQANVAGPLSGVVIDYTLTNQAKRLTSVIGTNNTTWVAKSVYGDLSSETIQDWIQPQSVDNSGNPSFGYGIKLYNGDPDNGGTEITTTDGQTGSGDQASVGWVWNYDLGLLFLSDDFKSTHSEFWVKGFVYDGKYLSDTNITGGTIEAANGLTKTGDTIVLGGELISYTPISGNSYDFNIGAIDSPVGFNANYASKGFAYINSDDGTDFANFSEITNLSNGREAYLGVYAATLSGSTETGPNRINIIAGSDIDSDAGIYKYQASNGSVQIEAFDLVGNNTRQQISLNRASSATKTFSARDRNASGQVMAEFYRHKLSGWTVTNQEFGLGLKYGSEDDYSAVTWNNSAFDNYIPPIKVVRELVTGSTIEGVTEVTVASYNVVDGDDNILVNFAGFSTINLPDSTLDGTTFTVNDMSGNATANTISVTTVGGSTLINGKNIDVINENYASATYLYYNGAYYIK
jgi:hypothetical protein